MIGSLETESTKVIRRGRPKGTVHEERPEPREYSYRDDGCEISTTCLDCPLPQCKYDDPNFYNVYTNLAKHGFLIFDLLYSQKPVRALAKQYNITERQIFRIRKKVSNNEIDFDYLEIFVKARKKAIKQGILHPKASSKKRASN